ncbi:helix-turn-helix domain-containing protein [Nakamurella sp.]|uniref:helix-turn-helix domain-containing protein n=1 Tax=Nakamurella sp. TaxID=1869182 RepID=UPI003B3B1D08
MPRKPGTPATVTGRVLAILDALGAGDPAGLSLAEISRRAELPLSTTFRLVQELLAGRMLARDEHRRYRIGPRLRELAG